MKMLVKMCRWKSLPFSAALCNRVSLDVLSFMLTSSPHAIKPSTVLVRPKQKFN